MVAESVEWSFNATATGMPVLLPYIGTLLQTNQKNKKECRWKLVLIKMGQHFLLL